MTRTQEEIENLIREEAERRTQYEIRQRWFFYGAKFALSMGSEWVKVEAKKPEFGQWVVCHCRIYGYYIGCYERILDSNWGQWNDGKQSGVLPPVFWQPLPTPPSK